MKIGDFVTAQLRDGIDGELRQGIYIADAGEFIKVLGESGTVYICQRDASIVADKNLWGSTRDFVMNWRRQL